MSDTGTPHMAFFGHDSREPGLQKRIAAMEANGCRVLSFTFARRDYAESKLASSANVHLGLTVDRHYVRRLFPLLRAVPKVLRHARCLRSAQVIYARNIDMLALAVLAKLLTGAKGKVAYEVLDVQRIFMMMGPVGRTMRAAERQLLKAIDLLVVSSPEFVSRYFIPVQNYRGPWHLLENKIAGHQIRKTCEAYLVRPNQLPVGAPWVIGWYGVLRCRKSLAMLARIADRLGSKVKIHIRGRLSREDISEEDLTSLVGRPNVDFGGSYAIPDQLAEIYSRVHFIWSIDYTDEGTNSDWLLPNRIYEGGYFGAVALGRKGTATGRFIEERGLGFALPEPIEESVCEFLQNLDERAYSSKRDHLIALPSGLFVDETDTRDLLARLGCVPAMTSLIDDRPQERYA